MIPEFKGPDYIPELYPWFLLTAEDSAKVQRKSIRKYLKENEIIPFLMNKYEFLDYDHDELYHRALARDSLKLFEIAVAEAFKEALLSTEELKNLRRFPDRTAEWLFKEHGGSDVVPIMPLIYKGVQLAKYILKKLFSRKGPEKAELFLSDTEIRVLKVIWKKRFVTPSTLHSNLPSNVNITSESKSPKL